VRFARLRGLDSIWLLRGDGAEAGDDSGQVEGVPAFDDAALAEVHDGHAGEQDRGAGGREAQTFAGVLHLDGPTDGDFVAFGDGLVDGDVDAGEGAAELADGGFELVAADDGGGLGEAVAAALGKEELVDGGFVALVPDFFKPADGEWVVGWHVGSPMAEG
jgi:hypothetical protein